MKLVSVEQMVAAEREADAGGFTYPMMMENAGRGLAEVVHGLPIERGGQEVLGLVGPGNNGGDTLVALSVLAAQGWIARALLIKRKPNSLVDRARKAGAQVLTPNPQDDLESLSGVIQSATILLDGVLGTGSCPPLKGEVAAALAAIGRILEDAAEPPYVVAVDCPSGMDCDSGEVAKETIVADLTVTMAAVKRGLLKLPAYDFVGDLRVVEIGLPPDLAALSAARTEVADEGLVAAAMPARPTDAHKGTFGTALIVAGSVNYTGAAVLAGKAAYRTGAGLVTLAVPSPLHAALSGNFPEATWILLPHEVGVVSRDAADVVVDGLAAADAVLIGPGLGMEDTTGEFVARLLAEASGADRPSGGIGFVHADQPERANASRTLPGPVFDADGLKLLSRLKDWPRMMSSTAVLTPHPGEMAVLTGLSKDEIQNDREAIAGQYAREWGHVVVLKGAFTVIASPDGRMSIIPIASSALARAGTGDVLAGIIVGLRAQGVAAYEAAVAAAWIHAQAGLHAAKAVGASASVMAGDVLDSIADVVAGL